MITCIQPTHHPSLHSSPFLLPGQRGSVRYQRAPTPQFLARSGGPTQSRHESQSGRQNLNSGHNTPNRVSTTESAARRAAAVASVPPPPPSVDHVTAPQHPANHISSRALPCHPLYLVTLPRASGQPLPIACAALPSPSTGYQVPGQRGTTSRSTWQRPLHPLLLQRAPIVWYCS